MWRASAISEWDLTIAISTIITRPDLAAVNFNKIDTGKFALDKFLRGLIPGTNAICRMVLPFQQNAQHRLGFGDVMQDGGVL
jgi:hypothetical protein